jgi:hypothetical protein
MSPVERFAAMAHVEVAHLSLDAAWVKASAAADAASTGDLDQQGLAPALEELRGE